MQKAEGRSRNPAPSTGPLDSRGSRCASQEEGRSSQRGGNERKNEVEQLIVGVWHDLPCQGKNAAMKHGRALEWVKCRFHQQREKCVRTMNSPR